MAYALLANCPPVFGIYTSIFPVFIYSFFGPSPHVSKGTNALMCMLTGSFVAQQLHHGKANVSEIVTCLCLLTGVWQIFLTVIQFTKLSWIMSDIFMSAYIAGASIHIAVSQLRNLLGLHIAMSKVQIGGILFVSIFTLSLPILYI